MKNSGKKEKEINNFLEYTILIFESEVKKYLLRCEIIIKYYLSKYGFLNNINIIDDNHLNKNSNDDLFKIDYKKYLFENLDLPNYLINKIKCNNNTNINNDSLMKEKETIIQNDNEINNIDHIDNNNYIINNEKKTFNEKIELLFMNSLKIIIREDELIKKYVYKIKDKFQNKEKDFRQSTKLIINHSLTMESNRDKKKPSNSLTINILSKKKYNKKTKTQEFMVDNLVYEEIKNQLLNEKRKFKYILIFLNFYTIRYTNIINECFNEAYNSMDDLIIMSVRSQNNTLNEFMNYLIKSLNNFDYTISLDNFEFDSYDIYRRYKVDINILYEKMKYNALYNTDKILIGYKKDEENNKIKNKAILTEEEMSYIQLFSYNLNDLMNIYNFIKNFGANTCNFLVKYDIVKEILIHQYFTKKKYGEYDNNKTENENNIYNNNSFEQTLSEENNGICKKILLSSNINYLNFLNKFSIYNNNYININELFTSLLLLGSYLINSEQFIELIKDHLPENKKESKNILLTKKEFMKIPLWFEKDEYLNILVDSKEQDFYLDIAKYYYSEENIEESNENNSNKPLKINAIKEAIFEINSEDNILDLNKIIILLNKINGVDEMKNIDSNKKEKENDNQTILDGNNSIKNIEDEINKKPELSLNEEINKFDMNIMNISKGKETDSKGTLTIQSDLDIRRKRKHLINKENINNIFNALFIS